MGSKMGDKDTGLAVQDSAGLPVPVFRGQQMIEALKQYRELQKALDEAMPDQIITLGDKQFRRKGYWRALATAFDLSVKPLTREQEERSVVGQLDDGSDNYVYTVTYVASTPSGRSVTGDGTCAAAEKAKGRMEATEHNVRSHGHTRAYNRAVSNLVGFGEVSAEEAERPDAHGTTTSTVTQVASDGAKPTNGQVFVKAVRRPSAEKKPGWITLTDGREGSTFDTKMWDAADEFKKANTPVVAEFEKKGNFTNITKLEAAGAAKPATSAATAAKPAAEDKEPFNTPEKVLTIKGFHAGNAEPDQAKQTYWLVQTDKHQYLTNLREHRELAEGARVVASSGARLIVKCKPMTLSDGSPRVDAETGVRQYQILSIAETTADAKTVVEGEVVPQVPLDAPAFQ